MSGQSPAARDGAQMRRALANAENGWGQTAPNPMVGAVVVSGDQVVADGWHARYGEAHAEVMALRAAGDRARGATLYVTLEPCAHHGKTPPCVDAIIGAGVARVVIATRDPNPLAGGGLEKLRGAGIDVTEGVEEDAARELNAAFFNSFASDRPWVILKLAASADGGIADPTGQRRWITGESSRREVHRMRANVDAVAVGIATVLADDPDLTVRDAAMPRRQPTRLVFDSNMRLPATARVTRTARDTPTIVIARVDTLDRRNALEALGVRVIFAADLVQALHRIGERGIRSILLEGGPTLAGSFLTAGLVDRLAVFSSPILLGPNAPQAFGGAPERFRNSLEGFPVVESRRFDEDSLIIRALRPIPRPPTR
jgi:diaminohydroxyphosphoribosylaminopyrimidine deaminase/5-amino-6-(5-phosphoribosylamino)uracil reductase